MAESQRRCYAPGEWIVREGDHGEDAFVVESGHVQIVAGEQTVAELGSGDIFGEVALILDQPRMAGARATDAVSLQVVPRARFRDRLAAADPLLRHLLHMALRRFSSTMDGMRGAGPAAAGANGLLAAVDDRDAALAQLHLEQDLAAAMAAGELQLYYQPIVRLADMRTAGFEALVRWHSLQRGSVSPGAFIPVAEHSQLIVELGRWALREGCAGLARMGGNGAGAPFVTVNLSGRQLADPTLEDTVLQALAAAGLAPPRLKLEITEGLLIENGDEAQAVLQRLRAAGVGVAVDDFGTGYSSLSYVHRLPADTLKLDRSFLDGLPQEQGSRVIVRLLRDLASGLGMSILAEGVAREDQAAVLRELGFEYAQGFLFSPAVPEARAGALVPGSWS